MNSNKRITRIDLVLIVVIMLIYSAVSFINLGDTSVPVTQPDMGEGEKKQYITYIALDEYTDIDSVVLFKGLGICGVTVYKSDDGGASWEQVAKQGFDGIYKWESLELDCKTQYLCISVGGDSVLELFEAGIISPDGTVLSVHPLDGNCRLFDEQQLVPLYPSYKNGTYFDEAYHARTAYEHSEGIYPYEISHPPLGKLIISVGIKLFGMTPFGWRVAGNLFGIMMLALMYVFAKRIFKKSFFAAAATLFLAFDFMHFTQTRIATIDSFAVFFIMLMYYLMYIYYDSTPEELPYKKALKLLCVCGVVFGLGISTKWICVYAGIGLAVLFAAALIRRTKEGDSPLKTCLWCVLFFIAVPLGIYFASYIPYYLAKPEASALKTFIDNQVYMLTYHGGLESTHDFESAWYTWPLMLRPMWYFGAKELAYEGLCSTIVAFGNPIVWWGGSLCAVMLLVKRKKCRAGSFILVGFLSQYLPWIFISRSTFIYHFFASVPFIILALVYMLKSFSERFGKGWILTAVLLLLAAVMFCMFYPVISGGITDRGYVLEALKWFDSWILCY